MTYDSFLNQHVYLSFQLEHEVTGRMWSQLTVAFRKALTAKDKLQVSVSDLENVRAYVDSPITFPVPSLEASFNIDADIPCGPVRVCTYMSIAVCVRRRL